MKNLKVRRVFSAEFKREKDALIEQGKLRVSEVCKTYEVSQTAVRKWLSQYGKLGKTERMVVEKISEELKNIELLKKIAELESFSDKLFNIFVRRLCSFLHSDVSGKRNRHPRIIKQTK
jgi:transposase-like protein